MKRVASLLTLMAVIVLSTPTGWAAPAVPTPTSNPAFLTRGTGTRPVTLSTTILDPAFVPGSAYLQRLGSNNQWATLGQMLPGSGAGVLNFTTTENTANFTRIRYRVTAGFKGFPRILSPALEIAVGVFVSTGAAQTITEPTGIQLTIPPGSTTTPLAVGVAPAPTSALGPRVGSLIPLKAVDVIVQSLASGPTTTIPVRDSWQLNFCVTSLSVPDQTTRNKIDIGDKVYVADKVLADYINPAGSVPFGLVGTGTATVNSDATCPQVAGDSNTQQRRIVTKNSPTPLDLGGYFGSSNRTYAFYLEDTSGSGFVKGTVSLANDINPDTGATQTLVRPGVYIENTTNSFLFYTDATGQYKVPISGISYTLTAFDIARCVGATANGTDFSDKNLALTMATPPSVTRAFHRPGIRNGGFEASSLTAQGPSPYCWTALPSDNNLMVGPGRGGTFSDFLGLGTTIQPSEGKWMIALRSPTSFVQQQFIVPVGVTELYYDFNFGCASNCGVPLPDSRLDDTLVVTVTGGGVAPPPHTLAAFGGQLGWRTGKITGLTPGTTITLRLTARDGDGVTTNGFPSTILVDNIRFRTVFLDVKILAGAIADTARVLKNVRDANEFHSQGGTSVQVRKALDGNFKITPIADPGGLADLDVEYPRDGLGNEIPDPLTGKHQRSGEEKTLLCLSRGAPTDVNVYYVTSMTGLGGPVGITILSDDYEMTSSNPCGTTGPLTQRGIIIANITDQDFDREVLAHELGHLLISPDSAGSTTEHLIEGAPGFRDSANIMQEFRCVSGNPPCSARALMRGRAGSAVSQSDKILIDIPPLPSCPVTCPN